MASTKKPRIIINPDSTAEERAAYWASLSKRERTALLRSGNVLHTSSAQRVVAVSAAREFTKGV